MSKKKLILLTLFTVSTYAIYAFFLIGVLPDFSLKTHTISDFSLSMVRSDMGDELETIEMLDRLESNHIIVELFAVKQKDGHESRIVFLYKKNLLFDRYQYWVHQKVASHGDFTTLQCDGFPNDCTFLIKGDTLLLDHAKWSRRLWSIVINTPLLIVCTVRLVSFIVKYRKEKAALRD